MKKITFLIFFAFSFVLSCYAQNPQLLFQHFSTSEGLPSTELFQIQQDKEGKIWIGSDNGVTVFDGYSFKNYSNKDGLKDNVVLFLQFDYKDILWVYTLSGKIFYYDNTLDKFIAYTYNNIIKEALISDILIRKFEVNKFGLTIFFIDGKVLSIDHNGNKSIRHIKEISDKTCIRLQETLHCIPIFQKNNNEIHSLYNNLIPFFSLRDNVVLSFLNKKLNIFIDKKYSKSIPMPNLHKISMDKEGRYYFVGAKLGIRRYENLQAILENKFEQFLDGHNTNYAFFDKDEGLWVSTVGEGLYYCPNISIEIYNKKAGFKSEVIQSITEKDDSTLLISQRNGYFMELNLKSMALLKIEQKIKPDRNIYASFYDKTNQEFYLADYDLNIYKNEGWELVNDTNNIYIHSKSLHYNKKNQYLYISHSLGFSVYDLNTKKLIYNSEDFFPPERFYTSFYTDTGQHLLGKLDGLFLFKDKQLKPVSSEYLVENSRIEDIVSLKNGTLIFATKGNGIQLKSASKKIKIGVKNGLVSNMIEKLYVDPEDQLWVCTQRGLDVLKFDINLNYTIQKYDKDSGLPSNIINDVYVKNKLLWVATQKGLVKLKLEGGEIKAIPPSIKNFYVNEKLTKKVNFSYKENNISVEYKVINYKMMGKIPYRYKLTPGNNNWTQTTLTKIHLLSLSPENYHLEIQAQNEMGKWSKSTQIDFIIDFPFWKTSWFYFLIFLSFLTLIYYQIFKSYKKKTEKQKIKSQIIELERTALQAQMNPHFIFNCLNGIQGLILENKNEKALFYLGKFAKFVRSNLNASFEKRIPLDKDIDMVKQYIEMEQFRFNHNFDYKIQVADDIKVLDYEIPPMLVQPLVENAVIHGITSVKKRGAIEIRYEKDGNFLKISIMDNGTGFTKKEASFFHSKGLMILQKRLDLLDSSNAKENYFYLQCKQLNEVFCTVSIWVYVGKPRLSQYKIGNKLDSDT